jgi:hypothetical protein
LVPQNSLFRTMVGVVSSVLVWRRAKLVLSVHCVQNPETIRYVGGEIGRQTLSVGFNKISGPRLGRDIVLAPISANISHYGCSSLYHRLWASLSCWKNPRYYHRSPCSRKNSHIPCFRAISAMDGCKDPGSIPRRLSEKDTRRRTEITS